MTNPARIFSQSKEVAKPNHRDATAWEGTVYKDVAEVDDYALVKINDWDNENHKPFECKWMPRVDDAGDTVFPSEGDSALIIMSDENDAWMIAWWPYG